MARRITLFFALLAASANCAVGAEGIYSLEEANRFRAQWNEDNWDEGGPLMRYVFLNMTEFWPHSVINRGTATKPLPGRLRSDVRDFRTVTAKGELTLAEYVGNSTVDGAIVVHRGEVVFEAYPRMRLEDKHNYMSVSKPFAATLIAILEDRGQVDVSKGIDFYLPQVKGSGWEGVSVRDVLDMASGIDCLEQIEGAYHDPATCYYQYEASLGWIRATDDTPDSTFDYLARLERHRPPGEAFEYTSVDTFMLSWLAEAVTGRTYAELLSTEIWQPMGAAGDAVITAPSRGVPIASAGMSSTLRDVVRFGLLFTPAGRNTKVVSDGYLHDIQKTGRPEVFVNGLGPEGRLVDGEPARHNSYQWDFVMDDGDFFKGGYGGQGLYVSPSRDLVIAFFGTFELDGESHEMTRVARQLAKSGLFELQGQ